MTTFRDAITEAMKPCFASADNPMRDWIKYEGVAGHLLAMPELEAIRQAIYRYLAVIHEGVLPGSWRDHLPESVIDWAMGGGSDE